MDKAIINKAGKHVAKGIKKIKPKGWLIICLTVVALLFLSSVKFCVTASSKGKKLGTATGTMVGRAIGSFKGITEGRKNGEEDAIYDAQNPNDIIYRISEKIEEIGKLEVLVASGTYTDILTIGGKKDKKVTLHSESNIDPNEVNYAVMFCQKYNAVFTVDLDNVDIKTKNGTINITLNSPAIEFIPNGDIEIINEFERSGFFKKGKTEYGLIAVMNSIEKIYSAAENKLQNDEGLMQAATDAAKAQLEDLVNAVSATKPATNIIFQ